MRDMYFFALINQHQFYASLSLVRLQLLNCVLHCTMASISSSSTTKKSKRAHKTLSIEEKVEILDQQHLNLYNLLCIPKKANKKLSYNT